MKRMKKLLVFLLAAVMVMPMAVSSKAKAAELTAAEILEKSQAETKNLKSCDEAFSMELGVKMKGMGQVVNIKIDGKGTEFNSDGNPVKAKVAVEMDLKFGKAIEPMLKESGVNSGIYKAESYVIAGGTGFDIYAKADVPAGEGLDWVKTNITQDQITKLIAESGVNQAASPVMSVSDIAKALEVTETDTTYVLDGKVAVTKKMMKDSVKQSGEYDKLTKKEKKQVNKVIKKLAKKVKPMKVNIVVDKETYVVLSETVDFNAYINSLVKAALTMDKKDKEMVKMSKQITITGCIIRTDVSNINSAADFTVPADAASAKFIPFEELTGAASGLY